MGAAGPRGAAAGVAGGGDEVAAEPLRLLGQTRRILAGTGLLTDEEAATSESIAEKDLVGLAPSGGRLHGPHFPAAVLRRGKVGSIAAGPATRPGMRPGTRWAGQNASPYPGEVLLPLVRVVLG